MVAENPDPVYVLHGQSVGIPAQLPFDSGKYLFDKGARCSRIRFLLEDSILVGAFGGRDANGGIASIGFVKFDTRPTANPPVVVLGELDVIDQLWPGTYCDYLGPFGSRSAPTSTFGTYGNIIALIGTDFASAYDSLLNGNILPNGFYMTSWYSDPWIRQVSRAPCGIILVLYPTVLQQMA